MCVMGAAGLSEILAISNHTASQLRGINILPNSVQRRGPVTYLIHKSVSLMADETGGHGHFAGFLRVVQ